MLAPASNPLNCSVIEASSHIPKLRAPATKHDRRQRLPLASLSSCHAQSSDLEVGVGVWSLGTFRDGARLHWMLLAQGHVGFTSVWP